jgi:hypothetical protein
MNLPILDVALVLPPSRRWRRDAVIIIRHGRRVPILHSDTVLKARDMFVIAVEGQVRDEIRNIRHMES